MGSVISVQEFIFILVCIQFSLNHISFYLVVVQTSIIILVYIQFSFFIKQIYARYSYCIQLKITVAHSLHSLISFRKTHISKFFFSRFHLPAVSIPQGEKIRSMYASDDCTNSKSRSVVQDCGTQPDDPYKIACHWFLRMTGAPSCICSAALEVMDPACCRRRCQPC